MAAGSNAEFDGGRTRVDGEDRAQLWFRLDCGTSVHDQPGQCARGDPGERTVRPAGENHRDSRTHDKSGGLRISEVVQLLGQHVARLQIRCDQNVGLPGDCRDDPLSLAAWAEMALSKAKGPSTTPPVI
jgi:hypothetical protein